MSTYRERREARAERLKGWADKREVRAEAELGTARSIGEHIPFGQPILVGHHSERGHRRDLNRINGAMRRSAESSEKAASMKSRAANIEAQLDVAIYDDDPDAIERLTERLAALEAERDRIKAYNASCRKGSPDTSRLTEEERRDLASIARVAAYQLGKGGSFPSYKLSNLSGNIKRNRDRLTRLQAAANR